MWKIGAGAVAFTVIMSLASVWAGASDEGYDPEPTAVTVEGEKINLTLDDLEAGLLHKFTYSTGNTTARFFAIPMTDGMHKVAMDACYICPSVGYYQVGEELICKNCGAPINVDTVGLSGGCNPRVLNFKSNGSSVSIDVKDLLEAARRLG